MQQDLYFEQDGKHHLKYNNYYNCYTAIYARSTKLPMFGGPDISKEQYNEYANKWLSKSRCKAIKHPVLPGEAPVAWFRVMHGYVPLYDRTGLLTE